MPRRPAVLSTGAVLVVLLSIVTITPGSPGGTATAGALSAGPDSESVVRSAAQRTPKVFEHRCEGRRGSGRFSNPERLGKLRRGVHVFRNCNALSSGRGFNVEYFKFRITRSRRVFVGTLFADHSRRSGVSPRLATARGFRIASGFRDGFWVDVGRGQNLRVIDGGSLSRGSYIIGAEKLSSPLRDLQTVRYSLVVWVDA